MVGNAGWLIPRKRWDIFLAVAAEVHALLPDTVFLIAGDGPDRKFLEAKVLELGLQSCVRFMGWIPDMEAFYRALDVLLFNSDFDALGRTPAEAAAHGVPVVASVGFGGLKELFRSSEEALIIDNHDIGKLRDAVVNLLSDKALHEKLSQSAYARVAEYGDIGARVDIYEGLLNSTE